jgi:hypothetical protein
MSKNRMTAAPAIFPPLATACPFVLVHLVCTVPGSTGGLKRHGVMQARRMDRVSGPFIFRYANQRSVSTMSAKYIPIILIIAIAAILAAGCVQSALPSGTPAGTGTARPPADASTGLQEFITNETATGFLATFMACPASTSPA